MNPNGLGKDIPRPGRLGLAMYARILGAVVSESRTTWEVAALIGPSRQSVHEVLWRLEGMGCAHVVDWEPSPKRRGLLAARFKAFRGESAPYPRAISLAIGQGMCGGTRSEVISFASILLAMQAGATRAEILSATGVSACNLAKVLREMRLQRLVHVCAWEPRESSQGRPAEVLKFGPGRDVQSPPAMSSEEKQRRYHARKTMRRATQRVVDALAGKESIVVRGVQNYVFGAMAGVET